MSNFKTEQEAFWHGNFGDDYVERNKSSQLLSSNIALFSKIFSHTTNVNSVIEFGANIGLNLKAIKILMPEIDLSAIEINEKAAEILNAQGNINVFKQSILEFTQDKTWDMTLIKGVLIHINPEELQNVYQKLYDHSNKYICVAEYYNPTPVEINYRGHEGRLFKRDFAGEIMDKFPDLQLIDYGFAYHRDNNFSQDDCTWFLLKK